MPKRCRLFCATDFQSLMYPCFTFCRILGTFPYKINNSIFEASKVHYIFSIIITCVFCIYGMQSTYKAIIATRITVFEDVTKSLDDEGFNILGMSVSIVMLVLSSRRMRLLQTIMEISSTLPPKSYQKLSRLIHFKDILGFFYIIGDNCIHLYMRNKKISDILYRIFAIYLDVLTFTTDMLYMDCVCILKACFKEINNNLLHMQRFIVNNELRDSTMFYDVQRNALLIMNLKALKKKHLIICSTVETLNKIFSLQLLVTIVLTFIEIIFGLYYYIADSDHGLINWKKQLTVSFITDMMYFVIKLLLLVWACETCKNEAEEIRTTIHDLLNSSRDEQMKNELQLFSLQLLHHKSTFSAKGFDVDATLLATMAGTITTYLVILVQFLVISHSCDENMQ